MSSAFDYVKIIFRKHDCVDQLAVQESHKHLDEYADLEAEILREFETEEARKNGRTPIDEKVRVLTNCSLYHGINERTKYFNERTAFTDCIFETAE